MWMPVPVTSPRLWTVFCPLTEFSFECKHHFQVTFIVPGTFKSIKKLAARFQTECCETHSFGLEMSCIGLSCQVEKLGDLLMSSSEGG